MIRTALIGLILAGASVAAAKGEPKYLYRVYSDADVVARVAVATQSRGAGGLVEYELVIVKPIKGVAGGEKKIKAGA